MKFLSKSKRFNSRLAFDISTEIYVDAVLSQLKNARKLVEYRATIYSDQFTSHAQLEIDNELPQSIQKTETLLNKFLNNNKPARTAELLANLEKAASDLEGRMLNEGVKQSIRENANIDRMDYLNDVKKAIEAIVNRLNGIETQLVSATQAHAVSPDAIANDGLDGLRQTHQELGNKIAHLENSGDRYDYVEVRMPVPAPVTYIAAPVQNDANSLMTVSPYVWGAAGLVVGALVVAPALNAFVNMGKKASATVSSIFQANTFFSGTDKVQQQGLCIKVDKAQLDNAVTMSLS